MIGVNSTDLASSAHTDALLLRFLHLFTPEETATGSGFDTLSWLVRKTAHVIEYAVLAILLALVLRTLFPGSIRGIGRELLWRTAVMVVPLGLVIGMVVMWLIWRGREPVEANTLQVTMARIPTGAHRPPPSSHESP
ncbi:MAG: VanZ family protein [Armatimonadetes bacterium]|nr:VanZ family protein [Armatimonadota bacterium]